MSHHSHSIHRAGRALAAALLGAVCSRAGAELRVVTTTPTLADITREVGGAHVTVESVMRGPENVHNVVAKPSFMMKLRAADLFVHGGLDGEPWAPLLAKGARKADLLPGGAGNVDASRGIALKEVPTAGGLTRALGDIHAFGNTHYALDPLNGAIIARTIAGSLGRADPANAADYDRNCAAFQERLRALTERLVREMEPYRGARVATYHRMWTYFLDRFGLEAVAEVEPKPGIAPGPQHLTACVEAMKAQGARVVIVETFNPLKDAEAVARRAEGKAIVLAHEVAAVPEASTYEKLFEHNVRTLIGAFTALGVAPSAAAAPGPDRPETR